MNLPLPFPSTMDDVDSLNNWMNDYQEYYNSHIQDEKIKKNFTFFLVKFINEITFALEIEGMGPRTEKAINEAVEYLKSRDKDTGKVIRPFKIEAANLLYDACKEFVRKVDCGDARSTRSYKQMKQAVEAAEERTT